MSGVSGVVCVRCHGRFEERVAYVTVPVGHSPLRMRGETPSPVRAYTRTISRVLGYICGCGSMLPAGWPALVEVAEQLQHLRPSHAAWAEARAMEVAS